MKAYIYFTLLLLLLMLSLVFGLSKQPTPEQYVAATHWCDGFGGMRSISFTVVQGLRVRCMDSKLIILDGSGEEQTTSSK